MYLFNAGVDGMPLLHRLSSGDKKKTEHKLTLDSKTNGDGMRIRPPGGKEKTCFG